MEAPQRVERLEERVAWLERHVLEQDKAMLEFAEELQRLKREVLTLREQSRQRESSPESPGIVDERPPHY